MVSAPVCILLATYNGAEFLQEQLASIRAQSIEDWVLLIRDDGSTDGTQAIATRAAEEDSRIRVVPSSGESLGAAGNFGRLMEVGLQTEADMFFFCDQDDVWQPEKLSSLVAAFDSSAKNTPQLVHSDLEVVDESLKRTHPSFVKYLAVDPLPDAPLPYLLSRNFVTGCAAAVNRALLERGLPLSKQAIMHDWWLALLAAGTGRIAYVPAPLVRYRQHESNTIGAKSFWHGLNPFTNWIAGWRRGNEEFVATIAQAGALLAHARRLPDFPGDSIQFLEQYAHLLSQPLAARLRTSRSMGLRQGNGLLAAIFYLRLVTISGSSLAETEQNQ